MFRRRNILILQNRTTIIPFLSSKYFYYKFSIPKKKKRKDRKYWKKGEFDFSIRKIENKGELRF